MAREFVMADTHALIAKRDEERIRMERWAELAEPTEDDTLFQLGDHGLFWHKDMVTPMYKYVRDVLKCKVICINGNHENYDLIKKLPTIEIFGGLAYEVIPGRVWILEQGGLYHINGKTVFAYGGGLSVDKDRRVEGESWWPQEIPKSADLAWACNQLALRHWNVDLVLSHTAPVTMVQAIPGKLWIPGHFEAKLEDPTCAHLEVFYQRLTWDRWFCGHFHIDFKANARFEFLWNKVVEL